MLSFHGKKAKGTKITVSALSFLADLVKALLDAVDPCLGDSQLRTPQTLFLSGIGGIGQTLMHAKQQEPAAKFLMMPAGLLLPFIVFPPAFCEQLFTGHWRSLVCI